MKYEIVMSKYKDKYKGIIINKDNAITFEGDYQSNVCDALCDIINELIRRQK